MKRIAYLFPGQGSQYVGMGKKLYDEYPRARALFQEADQELGFSLTKLCFQGPAEELKRTDKCQAAIMAVSIVALECLKEELDKKNIRIDVAFAAGLSLGEYSALVASGVLSFKDGLYLLKKRGEYMEEAAVKNPGKMVSLLGVTQEQAEKIVSLADVQIANLNCPGQVVVSGSTIKIERAKEIFESEGVKKFVELEVSGAFHSSLMNEASEKLKVEFSKIEIRDFKIPVVSNVTAKPHETREGSIEENLLKQLKSRTHWQRSMELILLQGVKTFLELGPGKVLKGLMRKIDPEAQVYPIESREDIEAFLGSFV